MNLNINVSARECIYDMTLSGEIDVYTAPQLKKSLLPLTEKQGVTIRINFEEVNYMDSTGLGILISGLKTANHNNTQIILLNLQDRVHRLFEVTGLKEVFNIESTRGGGV
jgi:anti-sigma B factor antagonist